MSIASFVFDLPIPCEASRPVGAENCEKQLPSSGKVFDQATLVTELYDTTHSALLAHLRVLGLSTEDAEDVINETFVRLMKHLRQTRNNESMRGWVFRVAYNLSMDIHRANKRFQCPYSCEREEDVFQAVEIVDSSPNPESVFIEEESLRNLRSAVLLLTIQQRRCILLRAEGMRYRQIAATLGISLQRAANLLARGTSHLKSSLSN